MSGKRLVLLDKLFFVALNFYKSNIYVTIVIYMLQLKRTLGEQLQQKVN